MLGITRDTLRNWERSNKPKPVHHPLNKYRLSRREQLQALVVKTAGRGESGT